MYNLVFPLSTRGLKTLRSARLLCCALWLAVITALTSEALAGMPVTFDLASSNCGIYGWDNEDSSEALKLIWFLSATLLLAIPLLLIISANLVILAVAGLYRFRHTGRAVPSWNAFRTVSLVAWGFLLSTLPALLCIAVPAATTGNTFPAQWNILAWELLTLNIWINPIIYSIINLRFRKFLVVSVSSVVQDCWRREGQSRPDNSLVLSNVFTSTSRV